jgi:hypothetical protein
VASDIRCFSFGYSASLDRKKQYVQSILHVDPDGFASRWKPGGPSAGRGGDDSVGLDGSVIELTLLGGPFIPDHREASDHTSRVRGLRDHQLT